VTTAVAAAAGPALRQAIADLTDLEAEAFESWKTYRERIRIARDRVAQLQVAELRAAVAARPV
jgi:hypothetical protein